MKTRAPLTDDEMEDPISEGWGHADWKDPQGTLDTIDGQLESFGLEIEQAESDGDDYVFRVVRRS